MKVPVFIHQLWVADMIGSAVTGGIRYVLYMIASACMQLMDYLYSVMKMFFGLQINDFPFFRTWFSAMSIMIGAFVLMRIVVGYIRAIYDEQAEQKINGMDLLRRMVGVMLVLMLVPVIMPELSSLTAQATTYADRFLGGAMKEPLTPSDVLMTAANGLNDVSESLSDENVRNLAVTRWLDELNAMDSTEKEKYIAKEHETPEEAANRAALIETEIQKIMNEIRSDASIRLHLKDINIDNINEKIGSQYMYFRDVTDLLLLVAMSCIGCYCFVYIALQIASRIIGLMFKILIAPYSLSGIVEPGDNSATVWFKLCMADFVTSFFQMIMIWFALFMVNDLPARFTGLSRIFFFLAALLSIMMAPGGIGQLIGGDVGASVGMQQIREMAHISMMTRQGFQGARTALQKGLHKGIDVGRQAGSTGVSLGAAGVYGVGRMSGGVSLNPANVNSPLHGIDFMENDSKSEKTERSGGRYFFDKGQANDSSISIEKSFGMIPDHKTANYILKGESLTRNDTIASKFREPTTVAGVMAANFAQTVYKKAGLRYMNSGMHEVLAKVHNRSTAVTGNAKRFFLDSQMQAFQNKEMKSIRKADMKQMNEELSNRWMNF